MFRFKLYGLGCRQNVFGILMPSKMATHLLLQGILGSVGNEGKAALMVEFEQCHIVEAG